MVAEHVAAHRTEIPAAIGGHVLISGERVNTIFIVRIHADLRVVERTVVDAAITGSGPPCLAMIVRPPKDAILLGLHHRVDHRRIRSAGADADTAEQFRPGEAVAKRWIGESGPRLTAIAGAIEPAARSSAA